MATGKVGADVSTEEARHHAYRTGIVLFSVLQEAVGSLDEISGIAKIFGMVNCTPDFAEHPEVVNGCSDLISGIFGDLGAHARSAVGMASLPRNITVEIEAVAVQNRGA